MDDSLGTDDDMAFPLEDLDSPPTNIANCCGLPPEGLPGIATLPDATLDLLEGLAFPLCLRSKAGIASLPLPGVRAAPAD